LTSMQSLLSQRGADRKKVIRKAGLPRWTWWAEEYAKKLDCTVRTIQLHIKQLREGKVPKASAEKRAKDSPTSKPVRLDGRQQAALVTAQLAANDLVAALKNGGDWQTPLAEYEKVAVSPAKLDNFLDALSPEPELEGALAQLVHALGPCEDALPAPAKNALRKARVLLEAKPGSGRLPSGKRASGAGKHGKHESAHPAVRSREVQRSDAQTAEPSANGASPVLVRAAEGVPGQSASAAAHAESTPVPQGLPPSEEAAASPPAPGPEGERHGIPPVPSGPGNRQGSQARAETGKPGPCESPAGKPAATAAARYQVRKRISGDYVDFAIFRRGDKTPFEVFEKEKESEARVLCDRLNKASVGCIKARSLLPQQANAQAGVELRWQ